MTTATPILMNDFRAEPPEIRTAMLEATRRVLESGWYVLGEEVQAFEQQWAQTCGVAQGVGVGNGMDAIEIALRAAGIGPGDEVITTAMTAFASVLAVLRAGATPVLADIDADTGLLSRASVA
jgi:dTDP-4-amino-4,6-dideoxygalactose transaminase